MLPRLLWIGHKSVTVFVYEHGNQKEHISRASELVAQNEEGSNTARRDNAAYRLCDTYAPEISAAKIQNAPDA